MAGAPALGQGVEESESVLPELGGDVLRQPDGRRGDGELAPRAEDGTNVRGSSSIGQIAGRSGCSVQGVGDELEQRAGQVLQVPLPAQLLADRQQGLPVLVAAPVEDPVEERLEQLLERGEERRAQDDGQEPEEEGVDPVLGEDLRLRGDPEVDEGQDEIGEDQGRGLLEDDLEVHELVAGDRVGEGQGDEGLEEDGQLAHPGRGAPGQRRG